MAAVSTPHRFTRDEYYRIGETSLFADKRMELLDGEIIDIAPHNPPHASRIARLSFLLFRLLGTAFTIRAQLPIILNDWSEPEPDVAICRFDADDYPQVHPQASDVFLVIEVAESTLAFDRSRKGAVYAGSAIPEYWIVNLVDRRIEVFSGPDLANRRYRQERVAVPGDTLLLPGGVSLAVADVW
ncbi:MAG: Uma2 family endonuclease [Deltaproteobacteria bacterium]|nr:Uma2 family endonuclease [Deltaproteobacteria bacterium]